MKKVLLFLLITPCLVKAQSQVEVPLQRPCPYGYLEYVPGCESVTENCQLIFKCPVALLINLDGWGARGNGTTELYKVANEGVAKIIKDGQWVRKDFVVISPQLASTARMYSPLTLNTFIKQMIFKYGTDPNQVYLVGLSGGANSIYAYITNYTGVRASVAISGSGNYKMAYRSLPTRLWEFHGDADTIVPLNTTFYKNYNTSADSVQAEHSRLTVWNGLGHTGWQPVYKGDWINKACDPRYDPFSENVFDWLVK